MKITVSHDNRSVRQLTTPIQSFAPFLQGTRRLSSRLNSRKVQP